MAVIQNFPQKVALPDVVKALVAAGMKEPAEVMEIGRGDIAFEIDGHDFYLKRERKGGFRFHVHGERKSRCKIGPDYDGLPTVVEFITQVLSVL